MVRLPIVRNMWFNLHDIAIDSDGRRLKVGARNRVSGDGWYIRETSTQEQQSTSTQPISIETIWKKVENGYKVNRANSTFLKPDFPEGPNAERRDSIPYPRVGNNLFVITEQLFDIFYGACWL